MHLQLRISRPGLYCPSGECLLSKPFPDLPWYYSVRRAYESPEGRGDGKGGMDQPVQGPWHDHKGNAWGHPLHQLVHDPETGEATLAEGFFCFF